MCKIIRPLPFLSFSMQIVSDAVWTKVIKKLVRRWILAKLSKPIEIPNKTIQNDQDLSTLSRVFNFESCSKWFEFFDTYTHRSVAIRSVSDPIAICHRFDDRRSIEESICCKLQHVWMACFFGTNRVIRCTLASIFRERCSSLFQKWSETEGFKPCRRYFYSASALCTLCTLWTIADWLFAIVSSNRKLFFNFKCNFRLIARFMTKNGKHNVHWPSWKFET